MRRSDGGAVFWRSDDERDEDEGEERSAAAHAYVSAPDDLESVSFAADGDAAADLESFASATDFESWSVLLQAREVRECTELRLRGVFRDGDGLETDWCSSLRPADVECDRDRMDTVAVAVRVPFSLADASGYGSSWSSGCDRDPRPVWGTATRDGGGES